MPIASNLRVLIVDDQASMRALLRASLEQLKITAVAEAEDGEEGFRALVARPVHLVITDFNMPRIDGLGLLRAIRSYGPVKSTAVIMLTGRADQDLVKRAVQFGVNNYLVKPFTVDVLRSKIEAVMGALT